LNRRASSRSVALDRAGMSCVTPGPEAMGVECQNWEQTRMSTDRIPMSKEGYEKLKAQLDKMKNEDMVKIAEHIAEARGYGDLSENAEFDAAVEAQGMLQARINDLQNKLGQAYIVDKSSIPTDRVVFGSKVRVLDLEINEEEDFILVGPGEEDYDQNKILLTSPIGQGLVGKKVGEQVEVQIPKGVLKLKIVGIGMA
jgi:transcription elongation factor GreA